MDFTNNKKTKYFAAPLDRRREKRERESRSSVLPFLAIGLDVIWPTEKIRANFYKTHDKPVIL